jgi:hypothetical protein
MFVKQIKWGGIIMNVNNISKYPEPTVPEKPQNNVQMELQKQMLKEATTGASSIQNQMLQLLASAQPVQNVQQTAQKQLEKGYLDIKV